MGLGRQSVPSTTRELGARFGVFASGVADPTNCAYR
jgi:hypothetical protein